MECDSPITLKFDPPRKNEKGHWMYTFPGRCGKCLPCLMHRKSQWSLRLVEEMRQSFSAYFITLTYDPKYIPIADNKFCANKNDHFHFIKWLKYYEKPKTLNSRSDISVEEFRRIKLNREENKKLKYYGVIEYGSRYSRPHMHYILFNLIDTNNIRRAWAAQNKISRGIYAPGFSYGIIDVQECNVNTIDYVLKYMVKPYKEDDGEIQKETSFMSKGMGLSLLDMEGIKHIQKPDGNSLLNIRGTKVAVPRYYQKKYLTEEQLKEKSKYINKQKEKKQKWEENNAKRLNINDSVIKLNGIENRFNSLKNIQKRRLE